MISNAIKIIFKDEKFNFESTLVVKACLFIRPYIVIIFNSYLIIQGRYVFSMMSIFTWLSKLSCPTFLMTWWWCLDKHNRIKLCYILPRSISAAATEDEDDVMEIASVSTLETWEDLLPMSPASDWEFRSEELLWAWALALRFRRM